MKNNKNKANPLSLSEIQRFFSKHNRLLRIEFSTLTKKEKDILVSTVKLTEESGELANEILADLSLQRKSKLEKFDKKHLYEEFADVILTTVSLANKLQVDLDRAVKQKLDKLLNVYSKDK